MLTYSIISPVRNEEGNLPRVAESLLAQEFLPTEWIVVDNGSTDNTTALVRALQEGSSRIKLVQVPGEFRPRRGAPIVRAFHAGLDHLQGEPDVIVKLDADTSFEPSYFRSLLQEFECDASLGMASGVGMQFERGAWRRHHVTDHHVWGPCRAYRASCLKEILPLDEEMGWDGVDEVKARLKGWSTRSIRDLEFRHHRPLGLRDGSRRGQWVRQGQAAHYLGYRPSYLAMRALFRMRDEPWALAMLWGYTRAALQRIPQSPDAEVRAHIRARQRWRAMPRRLREVAGRS